MKRNKWASCECAWPVSRPELARHPEVALYDDQAQTPDIRTSAPCAIVSEHAFPSSAKSAERIDGAMMAGGAMAVRERVLEIH